jgi:hypothetical protein
MQPEKIGYQQSVLDEVCAGMNRQTELIQYNLEVRQEVFKRHGKPITRSNERMWLNHGSIWTTYCIRNCISVVAEDTHVAS